MHNMTMEFCDDGLMIKYKDSNGTVQTKLVDVEEFGRALSQQLRVDTGLLPRNTRYFSRTATTETLVLEKPYFIGDITYGESQVFTVPIPHTVYFLQFRTDSAGNRDLVNSALFVTRGPIANMDTPLSFFPYGNIYADGRICWGTVRLPRFPSLSDASGIPNLLLSSNFNGDLSRNVFTPFTDEENDIEVNRSEHLMRYLNGKDVFPYSCLRDVGSFRATLRRYTSNEQR